MGDPTGETNRSALRLDFDRRLMLQFRGSAITSDTGLLAYRELNDALRLTDTAANTLADAHTGTNGHHRLTGLLRQSVFNVWPATRMLLTPPTAADVARLTETNDA
jgi:Transposase DDE domain group 1